MRIAIIEPVGRGGLYHYAWGLAGGLSACGAEVTLVTQQRADLEELDAPFHVLRLLRLWDPKAQGSPPPWRAGLRRGFRAGLWYREQVRLCGWLLRRRPDLVLYGDIRFPPDALFVRWLRLRGTRVVDLCHNVLPFRRGTVDRGFLTRRLQRFVYRSFDRVLVHYETNRRRFLGTYGLDPSRVGALRHGNVEVLEAMRDPEWTAQKVREVLGIESGDRVVLALGSMEDYKGLDTLAASIRGILQREPSARIVMAGYPMPGFDLEALRRSLEASGAAGRTHVVPRFVPDEQLAAWMEAADVCVFPYRDVFQSGACHLAQTFGRPVVASAVGAFPEVLVHGRTGLLVPPGRPEALAEAVGELLADPQRARAMGREARRESRGRFAWEGIARRLLEQVAEGLPEVDRPAAAPLRLEGSGG